MNFSDLTETERGWIDDYVDGTIEPEAFEALQDRLRESPELRAIMRRYLALDNSLQNESEIDLMDPAGVSPWTTLEGESRARPVPGESKIVKFAGILPMAIAASVAFFLGLGFMFWSMKTGGEGGAHSGAEESVAEGFAVINRVFNAEWEEGQPDHREGDTLGAEEFRLASGTIEIHFFSGATMTVDGPAEISLKSAWEASCREGSVRMQVPPAARGFKLHAPSTEIIDLGTEFGLVVKDGEGHVEVFDGEISLQHQGGGEQILRQGRAVDLASDGPAVDASVGQVAFPDARQFRLGAARQQLSDFQRWQSHRDGLAGDDRLIAYYTFDRDSPDALVPNLTLPRNPEYDGAVVLAEPVQGRWPGLKSALEFRRPGSRVRVNIPGEFPAFSFVAWVRIDSLDRWYNALFMADTYETGEPHWQIRDDGKMMLSVMVDDSRPNPKNPDGPTRRFQRLYYSPPMWDPSMSGEWMHLASVFDPDNRRVSHYVNGERISQEEITPQHMIRTLRIGNGEIGNWGQPFREDPTFAIRNLNGRMDEIAIFRAALSDAEIGRLYERSRVGGR